MFPEKISIKEKKMINSLFMLGSSYNKDKKISYEEI